MITSITLKNFKCFQEATIGVAGLTLLSGVNGTGKSSVIQALLLLRQSHQQGLLARQKLALNGEFVQIGTVKDAINGNAEQDEIVFEFSFDGGLSARWVFTYDMADEELMNNKTPSKADYGGAEGEAQILGTSLFAGDFQYLCAERVGPRNSFNTSDYTVLHLHQLGTRGEYTAQYLTAFRDRPIPIPELAHTLSVSQKLGLQVEAWLDVISPGTRLQLTPHASMDVVQLQYKFASGTGETDAFRPTNVGFGLTYTLPILVAVLSAKPGALLLLENPEAHLHPRGQVRMGELLALAASAGIQVIVETHSDHVLNGIRLAVHSGRLAPENVRLHFFERRDAGDRSVHEVISPVIDRHGRLDRWPSGFFDEWDESLRKLLRPAKR